MNSPSTRFREFRERAGLSHDAVARQVGISTHSVWDIESYEDELASCYSPDQLRAFARVLGVHSVEFFGVTPAEDAVSVSDLVCMIREECERRGVSVAQFGDLVGWRLEQCNASPERLLADVSTDGLREICRELGVDWHRVLSGL